MIAMTHQNCAPLAAGEVRQRDVHALDAGQHASSGMKIVAMTVSTFMTWFN